MTTPKDGDLEEYATAVEVNGIRRTLDSFMKTQEQCNTSMEQTLDKIVGKLDKLFYTDTPPEVEDKSSTVKSKPAVHTNRSLHFGPPQHPNYTHFYTPPHLTRAQYIHASDQGMSTTTLEMFQVDYDLHDCPWTELELEAFYELANRDIPPLYTHTAPLPQKQQHHLLTNQDTQLHTVPAPHLNPVQQHFHSQMQFQHKVVAKGPKLAFPEFEGTDPDG